MDDDKKTQGRENSDLLPNIEARRAFERVLIDVEKRLKPEINLIRFWELMAEHTAKQTGGSFLPAAAEPVAARRFEKTRIPPGCGKYGGEIVSSVPLHYWININDGEFSRAARRYVLSMWFQNQLDDA